MKTALNNVVLPTLFNVVNNIVQHCYTWLRANPGSTMLNNIVDNIEQCGQHNIVQGCFHQPWTSCAFFAVYYDQNIKKIAIVVTWQCGIIFRDPPGEFRSIWMLKFSPRLWTKTSCHFPSSILCASSVTIRFAEITIFKTRIIFWHA